MKFLHAADIHLGYHQYGVRERYADFARAFFAMAASAIAERVDFVLLAGDLFHERDISPQTLLQAATGLKRLRDAGIPVLAIEGNHELARIGARLSWVQYLGQMGLLRNLGVWTGDEGLVVAPWDEKNLRGAYDDLGGGVRVYGCRYYGASTAKMVEMLAAAMDRLDRPAYSILMLHTGIEGVLPQYGGGLTHAQLAPLRPLVDYLALGHIHKPFERDSWIYNPGSLETNTVQEVAWPERGYYVVEVDPTSHSHQARLVAGPRRAFLRLRYDVTPHKSPGDLARAAGVFLDGEARDHRLDKPVVELTLMGTLAFEPGDLPIEALRQRAESAFGALLVRVQNQATPPGWEVGELEHASRADLERHVLRELIERDERRRERSEEWLTLALRLKEMALQRDAPAETVAELRGLRARLNEEAP